MQRGLDGGIVASQQLLSLHPNALHVPQLLREGAIRVGPDIRDVRIKPPQALLSDILDPNRVAEERWTLYQVELKDGTTTAGIITSEGANEIELRTAAGQTQFIPRTKIATFSSTGRSLMPEGLEATITPPELADLITFLRSPLNK